MRTGNPMSGVRRVTLAVCGVLFVALGALGVILPGLPTTPFLLLATWCFARSFPALERRLLRNRFFAPYMRFVDGEPLPPRIKAWAIAIVWLCVTLSCTLILMNEWAPPYVVGIIIAAACIGTVIILRRGMKRHREAVHIAASD
ncbi:MAG: YbaN family protein [Phycisphaeraceae bacterium]